MNEIIALSGNPNSGKTTLFNELTGARQHVGNYPGVTVEKKKGTYSHNGNRFEIVDLPGTYSLTAYSLEEVVARDFLVNEKPGMVINIVDASNLQRNLYLSLQFMEMGIPLCIALNMVDVAKTRGIDINIVKLSELLGIPVIPTIARRGVGKQELMEAVADNIKIKKAPDFAISYGNDIDDALDEIKKKIELNDFLNKRYTPRWIALKYLESDKQIIKLGQKENPVFSKDIEEIVKKVSVHLKKTLDTYPEAVIADHRYGYIKSIMKQGVLKYDSDIDRLHTSDKIDQVVTNRFLGPIIMIGIILALYQFTFNYSEMPVAWFEFFFGRLGEFVQGHLPDGYLKSLVVSGVIDGVGGVLGFVPLIMFMFFGISILEDSGYLARVAYMLDRVFRTFGLHGSSVMPFIVSGGIAGGCAVPGVMATRTIKSPKERLATLLTVPFMNCGAKLPVFALLIAAFFSAHKAFLMVIITAISWLGALLAAKFLRNTIIKEDSTPFVMELPPYRFPTFKGIFMHTWERTWQYIKKAGTVILAISIVLWAMMTFPGLSESDLKMFEEKREALMASAPLIAAEIAPDGNNFSPETLKLKERLLEIDIQETKAGLQNSIAGRLGRTLEPLTRLAGFDWRTNIALLGGFAAKEVVVSTLGTAYSLGQVDPEDTDSLSKTLAKSSAWSPLAAFSLIIFTIFYAPCFVTVVCIVRESGSWKWGAFSMIFNTSLAFSLSVLVFQVGSLLGY